MYVYTCTENPTNLFDFFLFFGCAHRNMVCSQDCMLMNNNTTYIDSAIGTPYLSCIEGEKASTPRVAVVVI
jgi:hypothetical protein